MTDIFTSFKMEMLITEVIQLRDQRKELRNSAKNRKEENNHEIENLKKNLGHQQKLCNQVQSAVQYLRSQNDKLKANLIKEK